jgi:hypothetical protein
VVLASLNWVAIVAMLPLVTIPVPGDKVGMVRYICVCLHS